MSPKGPPKGPKESEIPGTMTPIVDDADIVEVPTSPDVLKKLQTFLDSVSALPTDMREIKILAVAPEDVTLFLSEWSPVELCAMFAHRVRRAAGLDTASIDGLVQKLMNAGKYDEAKIPAKFLMEKGRHFGYISYAKILTEEGKTEEALTVLRKGLDDGIKFPPRQYVSILIACGFIEEAIVECQELVEKDPVLWFSLAYCFGRKRQQKQAVEAFRNAIENNGLKESMKIVRQLRKEGRAEEAKKIIVKVLIRYMSGYHMTEQAIEQMGERLLNAFTR